MIGLGRYLLGVLEILLLVGFAWLGGAALRRWLPPRFEGAPAFLATAVLSLALLIWCAELLGSFGLFEPLPYTALLGSIAAALWRFAPHPPEEGVRHPYLLGEVRASLLGRDGRGWGDLVPVLIALAIASAAVVHFAAGVKTRLSTGMTGFDSTWYHGPFAAGFFQSGDTWNLHFIAPQFLAWFYPANGEIFHAVGMLAFGRDVLSPLLNLGWFAGCLLACWCIGRPYRVAPWSLALGAIALSVPALADQAGEARNDIAGIFFLLAGVAFALNARADAQRQQEQEMGGSDPPAGGVVVGDPHGGGRREAASEHMGGTTTTGPAGRRTSVPLLIGLSAGMAAGTKLNFLLPAAVLIVGLAVIASQGRRLRALAYGGLAALAGGGYWYLRNLAHAGNPLPWVHHLGPIDLPAPEQGLGGREAHSVLGYLTDGGVWSDWFLPGLHHGLWLLWPLLLGAAIAGLLLSIASPFLRSRGSFRTDSDRKEPRDDRVLAVAGVVGLASVLAWLIAPTSASGPAGLPRGFESGLRYLAPALILGLALLPVGLPGRLRVARAGHPPKGRIHKVPSQLARHLSGWGMPRPRLAAVVALLMLVAIGYPVQRHYLKSRYAGPTFTAPGLNAAFAWARDISDARIATTSTRQYPLFGTDLSNHVQYLGLDRPHGGFEAPETCPEYRRLLDDGDYDYVIATRDRLEPKKPQYPPQVKWTEGAGAQVILREPPTVVFQLKGRLDPSACGAGTGRPSRLSSDHGLSRGWRGGGGPP